MRLMKKYEMNNFLTFWRIHETSGKTLELSASGKRMRTSPHLPWIWYASLVAKPCCRYQPSRANSKISYKAGNWQTSPPLWRETAATGPSSSQRQRLRADLVIAFKVFKGLKDIDPNFPPSRLTWPKRAPLQGTPRCEPPPKERVGIFGEGCAMLK